MRCSLRRRMLITIWGLSVSVVASGALAQGRHVVGWIERAQLQAGKPITLKAKMDTGAKTSSLAVSHLQHFSRGGQPWVRFDVHDGDGSNVTLERPLLRMVRIKRHSSAPKARPVVLLGLCLDSVYKKAQVDLADRANFLYPLLIGRRFLQGDFLIDPGRTFITAPHCAGAE